MNGTGPRPLRLLSWKLVRKGALVGFATIELPIGLKVIDCTVCISHGKAWAALPAKPQVDKSGQVVRDERGKQAYSTILEWRHKRLRDAFSERVVALVAAHDPHAFDNDPSGGAACDPPAAPGGRP